MSEIERLRALLAEGTPGPWRSSGPTVWKPANPNDPSDWTGFALAHAPESDEGTVDAALIAAAVNALPALLDVAEAARTVVTPTLDAQGRPYKRAGEPDIGILRVAVDRLDGAT